MYCLQLEVESIPPFSDPDWSYSLIEIIECSIRDAVYLLRLSIRKSILSISLS